MPLGEEDMIKMHRMIILVPITIIALACQTLTLPSKPTAAPTSSADSRLLHFDNEWVAFDYPRELKVHSAGDKTFRWYPELDLGGELLAGLGDPQVFAYEMYFRSIRIMRLKVPAGYDLQKMMSETYDRIGQRNPIYEGALKTSGPVTVSGMAAYQKTYRVFSGEPAYDLRDIWVPHNGMLDIIAIATAWHDPDTFAKYESLSDGIVMSLVIKEGIQ